MDYVDHMFVGDKSKTVTNLIMHEKDNIFKSRTGVPQTPYMVINVHGQFEKYSNLIQHKIE